MCRKDNIDPRKHADVAAEVVQLNQDVQHMLKKSYYDIILHRKAFLKKQANSNDNM